MHPPWFNDEFDELGAAYFRSTGDRRVGEQRHRGCPVGAGQRHVLDDEASRTDEVVLFELGRPEVDLDGAQDRL